MASPVLHIKDSYYFEVPKALWPVHYAGKEDFAGVWVRLDPEFQLWEAERLYEPYRTLRAKTSTDGSVPSFDVLQAKYGEWKSHHANAGKPFARFLEEEQDPAWFAERQKDPVFSTQWQSAKQKAGDIIGFKQDASVVWSPQKIEAYNAHLSGKILIPQVFGGQLRNLYERESGFCVSKFMLLELAVALILCVTFAWLARQVAAGDRPRGRLWNLLEALVVFIRDQIARPAIGAHDGDRFVPLLLSLFFFILACNLFGMLPWLGAPTSSWGVTFGLACVTFGTVLLSGMRRFGPIGFFANLAPKIDLHFVLAIPIALFILLIEVLGLCIRHTVLSIRLLANMVAGHLVLLAIMLLAFSVQGAMSPNWGITAAIAVIGSILFSCLELFVALLQAYIFTFLSALFIGSAIHHH
jgi:F-type H+-transporting ATPase subunit a